MDFLPEGIIPYTLGYIQSMPGEIVRGDVFALTITLIAFFIAVIIINQLTGLLIIVLKKIILFIIVTLAFWQFVTLFFARLSAEGPTSNTIIFGAAGFIIGFTAISIALYVAFRSLTDAQEEHATAFSKNQRTLLSTQEYSGKHFSESAPYQGVTVPEPGGSGTFSAMKESLSASNLKNDRSLGAVLAYLVIAQFGVFSSKTIPAPSFEVGVAFFAVFIIAGLFFIHFTYNNYITGIRHLFLAILVGGTIAIILGHFWADIPFDQLISPAFFQSDALVALVTGLALSLFMGGKG